MSNCPTCKRYMVWTICFNCRKDDRLKEEKPTIIPMTVWETDIIPMTVSDNWKQLPMYTASYLNNVLKFNYNSIQKELKCTKVWDKYILHKDIIEWYKKNILGY